MAHYLSVCAIFKDEAPYLAEWLTFYELIGVDHFYLYENGSTDRPGQVLQPWLDRGKVTLRAWPDHPGQKRAYGHCLMNYRRLTHWLMFVDLDEFLFSPVDSHLPNVLTRYERFPGVGANWVMFGSSGHQTRPDAPVTLTYTRRAAMQFRMAEQGMLRPGGNRHEVMDYYPLCCHIKSIVQAARVKAVLSPHSFGFHGGAAAVDETGTPIESPPHFALSAEPQINVLRVNHYFARSMAEYRAKLTRPRADSGNLYPLDWNLLKERKCNAVEDLTILPIARRVAERLAGGP